MIAYYFFCLTTLPGTEGIKGAENFAALLASYSGFYLGYIYKFISLVFMAMLNWGTVEVIIIATIATLRLCIAFYVLA